MLLESIVIAPITARDEREHDAVLRHRLTALLAAAGEDFRDLPHGDSFGLRPETPKKSAVVTARLIPRAVTQAARE